MKIPAHSCCPCLDALEERYFTSHATLQPLKGLGERFPCLTCNAPAAVALPSLRRAFGLAPGDTWRAIFEQRIPIVPGFCS